MVENWYRIVKRAEYNSFSELKQHFRSEDYVDGFMEEYELKQKDLPELGSQGIVSEILNGKRELNLRQVKALSERFKVPASVFI